jgi:maleate cis-trans isomerase
MFQSVGPRAITIGSYRQINDIIKVVADGICDPCPRWPTITDVAFLEREIGKLVIKSSRAYIWHALKMANVKENVTG